MGRINVRDVVGLGALSLIVVGIWALAGWPWALIATGFPVGAFYLWGEVRTARGARISGGLE